MKFAVIRLQPLSRGQCTFCTVPKELVAVHKDLAQPQDSRHYPPQPDWRCIWCDTIVRGGVTHKCDKGPTVNFDHHK